MTEGWPSLEEILGYEQLQFMLSIWFPEVPRIYYMAKQNETEKYLQEMSKYLKMVEQLKG